jgi:hypothetical protein
LEFAKDKGDAVAGCGGVWLLEESWPKHQHRAFSKTHIVETLGVKLVMKIHVGLAMVFAVVESLEWLGIVTLLVVLYRWCHEDHDGNKGMHIFDAILFFVVLLSLHSDFSPFEHVGFIGCLAHLLEALAKALEGVFSKKWVRTDVPCCSERC